MFNFFNFFKSPSAIKFHPENIKERIVIDNTYLIKKRNYNILCYYN